MPRPLLPILRVGSLLALGALLLYRPRSPAPVNPPAPVLDVVWASDVAEDAGAAARPALGPLQGQKRPPCTPRREREVAGGCWIPHAERPPCPEGTFEGERMCLLPVRMERPNTSIGR